MSKALLWAVFPSTEASNCFGFIKSVRDEGFYIVEASKLSKRNNSLNCKKHKWNIRSLNADFNFSCKQKSGLESGSSKFPELRGMVGNPAGELAVTSKQKVFDEVHRQAALFKKKLKSREELNMKPDIVLPGNLSSIKEAYDQCGQVCAEQDNIFYLGTLLATPERRRALWATSVWCRRTDELVDGPDSSHITPSALDRWESRLEDIFLGRPFDTLDAALSDAVSRFHVDIQPFKDMIEGMRMDLRKSRYENFDDLYLYCYRVAGTVGLMSIPVMGIASESHESIERVYNAALALGIANQLTNILRDVGEDARRGRIYLPQDELVQAGLSEEDIIAGKVTDKWKRFMIDQMKRAKSYYDEAEKGITELSSASRWPVWASLLLYRQLLDEIVANDYNNFTKRAYVSKPKKLLALPIAYARSLANPSRLISPIAKA